MSTFAEKLAAKKAAPRITADVKILLAADLEAERDRLQGIIDTPNSDQRLASKSPADAARKALEKLLANAGDSIVTLRFTQLHGSDWSALTSQHPPRPLVPIDEHYGYNFDAATTHAARFVDKAGRHYGARVEDGEEVPLVVIEADPKNRILGVNELDELLYEISGHEAAAIRNTVWGLNEYLPKMQLEAMGKAFGATARSEKN